MPVQEPYVLHSTSMWLRVDSSNYSHLKNLEPVPFGGWAPNARCEKVYMLLKKHH